MLVFCKVLLCWSLKYRLTPEVSNLFFLFFFKSLSAHLSITVVILCWSLIGQMTMIAYTVLKKG